MPSLLKIFWPVLVILAFHTLFVIVDAYSEPGLDSLMHFLGGIMLGIVVARLLACAVHRRWCHEPGRLLGAVLVVALVATGALCWEIYEWLSDRYLGTFLQLTLDDTIKDLALGLAGGAASAWLQDRQRQRAVRVAVPCEKTSS